MLSVRFSSSLGRSLARAVQQWSAVAGAVTEVGTAQPAWIGKIPAEIFQWADSHSVEWAKVQSWAELNSQLGMGELAEAGSRPAAEPRWWSELQRELELRAALVQEQWAIRGPGLLAALNRFCRSAGMHQPLQVELVLPLQGGASQYLGDDLAWMEALLHDVSPQFSETLRVGWLVAAQACAEPAAARRLLLEAAADVEWLSDDPLTESALQTWLEGSAPATPPADGFHRKD